MKNRFLFTVASFFLYAGTVLFYFMSQVFLAGNAIPVTSY